ncbi:MAG: class I SAM-dependent methyltransferase [Dehalococcoidia bacterium]
MPEKDSRVETGHRWVAAVYDWFNSASEWRIMHQYRPIIMGEAMGRVLEIGIGTGFSLPYYRQADEVIGIEPDPHMLKQARERLAKLGLTNVELRPDRAEALPFEDSSFDAVVSSLVLCTVRDVPRSLAEAKRVLKPDGTFRFMEHVRSDGSFMGTIQDWITPIWRWLAAGCHANRRTEQAIAAAGFQIEQLWQLSVPPGQRLIVGIARPA